MYTFVCVEVLRHSQPMRVMTSVVSLLYHTLTIQEVQLTVSGERMCPILINCLEDKVCPVKGLFGKLIALDMTHLGSGP